MQISVFSKNTVFHTRDDDQFLTTPLLQKLDCETDTIGLYRVYNAIRDAIGNDTIITVTLTPFLDKGGLLHTNPSNFKVIPSKTLDTSINESESTQNTQTLTDKK